MGEAAELHVFEKKLKVWKFGRGVCVSYDMLSFSQVEKNRLFVFIVNLLS